MLTEILLRITDLSRGGSGVGKNGTGQIVFVPFTAPGDLVRIRLVESNKRYLKGELIEVLEPSPQREAPRCEVFGTCGGCDWQHIPYVQQWETKRKGVSEALKRAGLSLPGTTTEIPAEKIWNYRNRVQLRGNGRELGFFKKQTQKLVPALRCEIAHPKINTSWNETILQGQKLERPYKVEVEIDASGELIRTWDSQHAAQGFRQVHDEQNVKMKVWIDAYLRSSTSKGSQLLDLFGGSGNLSSSLENHFSRIDCVDVGAPKNNPAGRTHFHSCSVAKYLQRKIQDQQANPSLERRPVAALPIAALIDPPRGGLGEDFEKIARALESLGASHVVAVGCDPDAWARDLSKWSKRGWQLEQMLLIDFFPQTPHIESVAALARLHVP